MDYEIRPLAPEDDQRHRELMNQAFSRGSVVPPSADVPGVFGAGLRSLYKKRLLKAGTAPDFQERREAAVFGLFDPNNELGAALSIHDFRTHWGPGQTLAVGGLANVATFAEARGRGYVAALLRHSLERMRERGQVLSALYPFAWAFYRRYGWEWVGEGRRVTLPLSQVRASPEGKNVHALHAEEALEALHPIYTTFARRYRGVFDAATHQWNRQLSHRDNRVTYVYVHQMPGSVPDGYLLWRYLDGSGGGRVREFVANTPAAYRGLLSLLHCFQTQCAAATVDVPADDPLWAHVMHRDLETKIGPVFMGRVVDVRAALIALNPEPDTPGGAATMALRDENAPWNEGTWRIECEAGVVTCAPAASGTTADLACGIQAFSQAFWGTPSLAWLHRAGRVEVNNERAFRFLNRLLSGPPVWTFDDF